MNMGDAKWLKRILWGVLILTVWNYPKILLDVLSIPLAMVATILGLLFPGRSDERSAPESVSTPLAQVQHVENTGEAERAQKEVEHIAIRQEINRFAREHVPETWASLQEANVRKLFLAQQVEKVGKACEEANVPKQQDTTYQRACALLKEQEKQCADLERAIREAYRASLVAESLQLTTPEEAARVHQELEELEQLRQTFVPEPLPVREERTPSFWERLWK